MTTIKAFTACDSKAAMLAEVSRLQNNTVTRDEYEAMRKARDLHGANSSFLMRERDRLQLALTDIEGGHRTPAAMRSIARAALLREGASLVLAAAKETKVCRICKIPKDIHSFRGSEWKTRSPRCTACLQRNRKQKAAAKC